MTPKFRISAVSLLAIGIAMPAMAQTPATAPAPQTPPAASETRSTETVVITANKREESVQDVAVAVTAVTSEMREQLGIASITDLTNLTPGLSYTAGNERITLRGIGRNTNNFGAEPGVANYTDGIYQSFASIAGRDNLFVDRIEVLRGPQGTLYGRNSIGGALNIVSKRPTDDLQVEGRLGYGNFDQTKVGASVSGPITDWLRYRVVAVKETRDEGVYYNYGTNETEGYQTNNWNGEIQFEGDIGDRFTWWTKYTGGAYKSAGPPGGTVVSNNAAPYDTTLGSLSGTGTTIVNPFWAFSGSPLITGYTQCGSQTTNPGITNNRALNDCHPSVSQTNRYNDFALEAIYSTDTFDIKYVGGYVYYDYQLGGDQDDSPLKTITYRSTSTGAPSATGTLRTINVDQLFDYRENRAFFSNEVNFISTTDGPLQWIAGLYAYQENFSQPVTTSFPDEPLASGPGTVALNAAYAPIGLAAPNPNRLSSYTNNKGLNNSYGVYAQGDWQFTDTLKATVGVRYSVDNKHIQEEARLFCFVQCSFAPGFTGPYTDVTRAIWNGASPVPGIQPGVSSATATNQSGVTYNAVNGNAERLLEDEWDAVTGTAGLEWSPTTDTLVYGKYSRGYKTGGFNATSMAPLPRTAPETVNSYEAGLKQEFRNIGLTTNVAAFYYDYQDVQVPITVQPAAGLAYSAFVNIPKVETTGVELESSWNPIDDLNLRFTYAYLNSEVKESESYVNALCVPPAAGQIGGNLPGCPFGAGVLPGQSVEGNTLPQSPKHKVAFNGSYTFNFEDGATLTPSLSWYWRDKFTTSLFNNAQTFTPDFQQTDARLIWNDADGHFTVIGWVRNAFDEEGYDARTAARRRSDNSIITTDTLTLPRMYGIELQFHFR